MIFDAGVSKLTKRPVTLVLTPESASDELLLKRMIESALRLVSDGVGFKIFVQSENEDEVGFEWQVKK
jgi:hypothetical protein